MKYNDHEFDPVTDEERAARARYLPEVQMS